MGRIQPLQKAGRSYGGKIRLADQPREGSRWKVQEKLFRLYNRPTDWGE